MNHRKAMALLQEAADGRLNPAERPALEQHLAQCDRCREYAAGLPLLEDSLRRSLQTRYPESTPDLRPPASALGNLQTRDRRMQMSKSYLRSFSWVVLAALFVFALSWVFRNLTPKPTISPSQTSTPPATRAAVAISATTATLEGVPTPIETQSPTLAPTLAPTITPSGPTSGASPIFPNLNFSLGGPLPDGPQTVNVYTQPYPPTASVESVRQLALRLGLDAPVYSYQGEGNDPIYIVSDGFRWLSVSSGTTDIFSYNADYRNVLSNSGEAPSYEQALAGATAYLEKLGLLDMPYTTQPLPDKPGGVRFSRTLDDRPLVYGIGNNPSLVDLVVVMGSDGQVKELDYSARHFQKTGDNRVPEQLHRLGPASLAGLPAKPDFPAYALRGQPGASPNPAPELDTQLSGGPAHRPVRLPVGLEARRSRRGAAGDDQQPEPAGDALGSRFPEPRHAIQVPAPVGSAPAGRPGTVRLLPWKAGRSLP